MTDFAVWFAHLLARHELSQEAAARALAVSVSTVRRWLQGRGLPRYGELWRIFHTFGEHPFPRKGARG